MGLILQRKQRGHVKKKYITSSKTFHWSPFVQYSVYNKRYPATGRGGPRGSGQVKVPDFLDFRHYKGSRSSAKRKARFSFSEAESTSGHMVWSEEPTKKIPRTQPGIDPGTVRLVAQHLNHYATPGPSVYNKSELKFVPRCGQIEQNREQHK